MEEYNVNQWDEIRQVYVKPGLYQLILPQY